MTTETFVPHAACTVASGDCFVAARCLRKCQTRLAAYEANARLTEALSLLKELRDYTMAFRGVTKYVDGSKIDDAVKQAGTLIARHEP